MSMRSVLVVSVVSVVLVLLAAGGASLASPPTQSNSGNLQGWGGMVVQKVDCGGGTLALVDRTRALSNPQKPQLWQPMIIADLKDSVITREGLQGPQLTCKDLRPFQMVTLTGEVRESHTSWSAQREANTNWLAVSAERVIITGNNVLDSHETTITRSTTLKEVGENFVVVIHEGREQKVDFLPTTMVDMIKQGLWVEEPLAKQLRPGMRVAIGFSTRPDRDGVFTRRIAITSMIVP